MSINLERPEPGGKIPSGWFQRLYNLINGLSVKGDGKTIRVNRMGMAFTVSAIEKETIAGGGDTYTGYFTSENTSDETDQKVTVSSGYVVSGLNDVLVTETELTMSQTVTTEFIYVKIVWVAGVGAYGGSIENGSARPVQINGEWYHLLYTVDFSSNVISSIDRQFAGEIHVSGRIV